MHTIIMQQKNIGHHARLKENEHLLRYRAQLVGNFFRCVRARANLHALMTQKSCAVGMRNAILRILFIRPLFLIYITIRRTQKKRK